MWKATVLAVTFLSASCADARTDEGAGWQGTIDTAGTHVVVQNPATPMWGPDDTWQVVPELRIGAVDGTGPDVFGRVGSIAVSPSGDIAVLDSRAKEIRVFDADGRALRTLGGDGDGPGEFRGPVSVHYDSRGGLWVPDATTARYGVFDGEGAFVTTHPRLAGIVLRTPGVMMRGDTFLDVRPVGLGAGILPVRVDTRTGAVDSLPLISTPRLPDMPIPAALAPFMSRSVRTFDVQGDLWLAPTDTFVVYRRAPNGDTLREIRVPIEAPPFTAAEEDSIEAVIRAWPFEVDRSALGIRPQLIRALHVDDEGRVYVRLRAVAAEPGGASFEVLDSLGRHLGTLTSPLDLAPYPPPLFKGDRIYGVVHDELGVAYVVRARIARGAGRSAP